MANSLLGMFQPQQGAFQTLLGEYYDPKQARMKWIGGSLQGLGMGLASGRPGAWAEGLAMGGGNALEDYQKQALLGYGMQERKQDQEWQAKERARQEEEWASQDAASEQLSGLLGTIQDPQERAWAQMDPKGYFANKYGQRESKAPSSVQEYEYAVQQGYKGSYTDFKNMGKSGGLSLGIDPETGALTIGNGGGGGAALPAEMGGRLGLGEQFLQNDVPAIAPGIRAGDATGPIDYWSGVFGRGNSGVIHRRMATGADALRRGLTGAGMGMAEAEEYARRYLPTWSDDAATLEGKLKSLENDLTAVKNGALAGKTGNLAAFLPGSRVFDQPATTPNEQQSAEIPPEAVAELKADPSPAAIQEFDAVFGEGAAMRVLGGR